MIDAFFLGGGVFTKFLRQIQIQDRKPYLHLQKHRRAVESTFLPNYFADQSYNTKYQRREECRHTDYLIIKV